MSSTSSSQVLARIDGTQQPIACNVITSDNSAKSKQRIPDSLKLRFSEKADLDKIEKLFQPENKIKIDPEGFVMSRSREQLETQVVRGSAGMLVDECDNIRVFCLASDRNQIKDDEHYTEIGAVMTDIRGFRAPQTLISALSLKEQRKRDKSGKIYSKVASNNGASNAVFSRHLSWQEVTCPHKKQKLFMQAYPKAAHTDPRKLSRTWYHHSTEATLTSTTTLLHNILKGCLTSKDGVQIPLDLQEISPLFSSDTAPA